MNKNYVKNEILDIWFILAILFVTLLLCVSFGFLYNNNENKEIKIYEGNKEIQIYDENIDKIEEIKYVGEVDYSKYSFMEKANENVEEKPKILTENQKNTSDWQTFNTSAYCACSKCCGQFASGYTASGTKATANKTIAMSSKYKFGTKVEIQGYGTYIVEDRGGAIQGNKIDIFFDSHNEALKFGRRNLKARIII